MTGLLMFQDAHDAAQIHRLLHGSREKKKPEKDPGHAQVFPKSQYQYDLNVCTTKKEYTQNVYQLPSKISASLCLISKMKLFRKPNT